MKKSRKNKTVQVKKAKVLRTRTDVKAAGYCQYLSPDWQAVGRCIQEGGSW